MAEHSDPMAALRYGAPHPPHGALEIRDKPCPYCAVWIGPHRHWLREDGSLGLLVQEPEPNTGTGSDD